MLSAWVPGVRAALAKFLGRQIGLESCGIDYVRVFSLSSATILVDNLYHYPQFSFIREIFKKRNSSADYARKILLGRTTFFSSYDFS